MSEQKQETVETPRLSENEKLRRKLIRIAKGLGVLAASLLLTWLLLGSSKITPILAFLAIFVFLLYALYVWLDWEIQTAPRRSRSERDFSGPPAYPLSQHTPTTYAYVREPKPEPDEGKGASTDDGEKIIFRAHWAYFFHRAIFPALLLIFCILVAGIGVAQGWKLFDYQESKLILLALIFITILWIAYAFLDWINDTYTVEADRVTDVNQRPFAKKDVNIAMMGKIQSVQFRKNGLSQLLMDYGTLRITVGESELSFDYVPHPEAVQELILQRVDAYDRRQKQVDQEKQQGFIDDLVTALRQNAQRL